MKKFFNFLIIIAIASIFLFASCKGDKKNTSSMDADESITGKIKIYTSIYQDILDAVSVVLEKKFPNLQIEYFQTGGGVLVTKVNAEIVTGKLGGDMVVGAEIAYALELKEQGILHSYKSPLIPQLAFDYDKDFQWYPLRLNIMVLAYNPEKYNKKDLPNSFYDFAFDSRVAGAISMSNPLTSATAMMAATALRDKYGYEYYEALGKQKVMIESGPAAITKLETGECKVIMVIEESVLKKREEEKSKIEVIYPTDGVMISPSPIMIINDKWNANKNTKAAEAITDFLLGPEGQKAWIDGWMHSVLKDFPAIPYDSIPLKEIRINEIPVNWEAVYRQREEVRTKFEQFVSTKK